MDLQEFKTQYFLFDPVPYGRILSVVDFGNVRPWAKELWPDENGLFLGKLPKCNFDVEITMDLLLQVDSYDSVLLFSGDSDFSGLLNYLKSLGKKIIVICTRKRMSAELQRVAEKYIPAETLRAFLRYETTLRP